MTLANNLDPKQPGLPDTTFFWQPDAGDVAQKKAALGIVNDSVGTVVVPFTQMQQPYNYQAPSNRPLLDFSLEMQRILLKSDEEPSQEPSGFYQTLLSYLPEDIRTAITARPLTDPNMIALNNVLIGADKVKQALTNVATPLPDESLAADSAYHYENLADSFSLNALNTGQEVMGGLQNTLTDIGRNDFHFDNLSNLLQDMGENLDSFKALDQAMHQPVPPANLNTMKEEVAASFDRLNTLFNSKDNGGNLQALKPLLNALSTVATALTATNANPSIAIGSYIGSIGQYSSENGTGIIGKGLEASLSGTNQDFASLFLPDGTSGDKATFSGLLTMGTLLMQGLSAHVNNISYSEDTLERDPKVSQFTYQIGMTLLSNTTALEQFSTYIASASGISEANQPVAAKALSAHFLLGLAYAGAKGSPSEFENLVTLIANPLADRFQALEDAVNNSVSQGSLSGQKAEGTNVFLSQARIALQNEDYNGFASALESLYELNGTSGDEIKRDYKYLGESLNTFDKAVSGSFSNDTNTLTGIQRMV